MKKDLNYYLNLNYPITLSQDEENGKVYFEAEIPDLPGCGAHGETIEEALKKLDEAKKLWLEVSLERNLPIPEPASEDEFSGKFLLRIPARLHMQLTKAARKESMSLNQYIRSLLERQLDINTLLEKIDEISKQVENITKVCEEVYEKLRQRESLFLGISAVEQDISGAYPLPYAFSGKRALRQRGQI